MTLFGVSPFIIFDIIHSSHKHCLQLYSHLLQSLNLLSQLLNLFISLLHSRSQSLCFQLIFQGTRYSTLQLFSQSFFLSCLHRPSKALYQLPNLLLVPLSILLVKFALLCQGLLQEVAASGEGCNLVNSGKRKDEV